MEQSRYWTLSSGTVTREDPGQEGYSMFVVNRLDRSPAHNMLTASMGGDYDSRCAYCYVGADHSENAHVKHVAS